MLVIGRKIGESLRIGAQVTVTVREVRGKHVKLAISAPTSVAVARAELDDDASTVVQTETAPEIPG